jgi:hypothetical protein
MVRMDGGGVLARLDRVERENRRLRRVGGLLVVLA